MRFIRFIIPLLVMILPAAGIMHSLFPAGSQAEPAGNGDAVLTVSEGDAYIKDCYEGLEGLTISISGGNRKKNASDCGINAAGGSSGSNTDRFFGGETFASAEGASNSVPGVTVAVKVRGDETGSCGTLDISGVRSI